MRAFQILIDGFAISALYALGATGFTLIFGVSGVLNLSHGAIMVAAAVAAWAAASILNVGTYAGALIGVGVALLTSFATYFAVVKPIQDSRRIPNEEKEIFVLTGTLLWGIMIQEVIAYFFTNNAKTVLPIVEGDIAILGVRTPRNEVFTAVVCCFVIALLWALVNRTRTGKAVLAASMNPRGVTLLGLELTNIYIVVWAIYGILAGIAGVLLGMFLGVSSYSVGPLTASAFSIVVLGGLGSVSGSLIAAFVVGYLETLTAYLVSPAYRTIPALLLLVFVMYIRPQGLLGRRGDGQLLYDTPVLHLIRARRHRGDAAALRLRLRARASHRRLLFRRVCNGVGPAFRLRRRGQFRADLPDRRRRLHRRHPECPVRLVSLSLHRARRARLRHRRPRAGAAGASGARTVFRPDHAGRGADAAEFHRGVCRPHRWRDRAHHSRRHLDQRRRQLLDRARLHDDLGGHSLWPVAVADRPGSASQRPGSGAGRRARLQHRQAQARRLHRQRVLLGAIGGAAGILFRHRLGRHCRRRRGRRQRDRLRRARRPAHRAWRGAGRDLPDRRRRVPAPDRRACDLHRFGRRAARRAVLPRRLPRSGPLA